MSNHKVIFHTVVGCPHPVVPRGAKWERRGDIAHVTCNATGGKWELQCKENQWHGIQGNCTESKLHFIFISKISFVGDPEMSRI